MDPDWLQKEKKQLCISLPHFAVFLPLRERSCETDQRPQLRLDPLIWVKRDLKFLIFCSIAHPGINVFGHPAKEGEGVLTYSAPCLKSDFSGHGP